MAIHVALSHQTRYRYDRPVSLSPQVIRLRPAPHARTPILSYALSLSNTHFINWQQDPHSNYLARATFPEKTDELRIDVDVVVEMSVFNPFDFFLEPSVEEFPFRYTPSLRKDLEPFLETAPPGPRLLEFLGRVDRQKRRTVDFLVDLNRMLSRAIAYVIRLEAGVQAPDETLALGSGSCRDTAWLLVQILRRLGLASRFVSGYLIQLAPDVKPLDGPAGPAADFTDLHAWAEVYLPGAGWIGLDPTSGLLAGEGHLPLAATPEPGSAAPVTGEVDPCEVQFEHRMHVRRIHESPRVTRPYTDEQWRDIDRMGRRIDQELGRLGVRLTMGGEPTFVSVDDMDAPEWNVQAAGGRKRAMAGVLLKRLKARVAPGALLHYGQGKWYPGEPLPRWALACWWRRDGVPIWRNERWMADEDVEYGHGEDEARRFIGALACALGVGSDHVVPAYEDVWYYLWRERRLPTNVDPLQSRVRDEQERVRLARVFERGLDRVVGYVLPLWRGPASDRGGWTSGVWHVRGGHLFLIPGDSPIGYRLPLDSLAWTAPEDVRTVHEPDLHAARPPFTVPPHVAGGTERVARSPQTIAAQRAPGPGESDPGAIRTALCVEPRHGRLHVFMPPVSAAEDYLDLIHSIEDTAARLELPVIVEGTPPPGDPRLHHFSIAPDPGVIEVNLDPQETWEGLVDQTTTLYEEARLSRLGTEKFMFDGRHTGTGGGNHIVLGGATPADSPMLRRPDLLRSLLAYWNNHPSLSCLFSGLFLGPTSQHPRVDEARNDAIHELEIAFSQVPDNGGLPWLVDRVFRNVLVDVTGNTHRTEFCIDKLYAPESASGRQGLVELRAFEMPPHARMSLTQQLLLRALVAVFWKTPYRRPVVRWGTELHDRFLLPHFVAEDFRDVLGDLDRDGFRLQAEWFAPHVEFRFPLYGAVAASGVHLELRHALEPWPVTGEEAGAGGPVRYVDSSVERLQVKVTGLTPARHVIACNGRRVPLHPTGTADEQVAGVRYRAWPAASSLHPTVPVHAPLIFDVVDTWNERSVGGCVYHVAHPGGRHFEDVPVNAYAAESRRLARFSALRHSAGPVTVPIEERDPDFPLTLDLRRPPVFGMTSTGGRVPI